MTATITLGPRHRLPFLAPFLAVSLLLAALAWPATARSETAPSAAPEPAAPAASTGTIVWAKGGQIWAMNADGSNPRVLIPLSAAPGMNALTDPAVHPNGRLVAFNANTTANRVVNYAMCGVYPYQYPCNTTHYGFNATGTYRWDNGAVTRLTGAPAYCYNCSSGDDTPEPRADGHLVYRLQMCTGFLSGIYDCVASIKTTAGQSYPTCDEVVDPSANPVAAGQVAYTGCWTTSGDAAVVVTGPDRVGEHVVGCDDQSQRDPSWSLAGDQVVVAEDGVDPGLWVYGASNTACFSGSVRYAVVAPTSVPFSSPRFTGDGRIIFEAQGEIWSVPATCNTCAFPAQATQLTTGANNYDPAWTSDPLSIGSTPGPGPGPGGDTTAPTLNLGKTKKTQRVGKSGVLVVRLSSTEAATVKAMATIALPGKDRSATGQRAVTAGASAKLKVKLGKATRTALNSAWKKGKKVVAKTTVIATDAAGNVGLRTVKVKLKR